MVILGGQIVMVQVSWEQRLHLLRHRLIQQLRITYNQQLHRVVLKRLIIQEEFKHLLLPFLEHILLTFMVVAVEMLPLTILLMVV